jgi:cytochrome c oxidase assembly factor CtaG
MDTRQALTTWTTDPWIEGTLAATTLLYLRGAHVIRQARGTSAILGWRLLAFIAAQLVLVIALLSPLDFASDYLFAAHMTQHELLLVVAPPLFVLSNPWTVMLRGLPTQVRLRIASLFRSRSARSMWRALTDPVGVVILHGLVIWAWHVPALFEACLHDERIHALQHFSFFATAGLFWWTVLRGRYGRTGYGLAVLFVFATAMHTSILGAVLGLGEKIWYPDYVAREIAWGVSPLDDQRLAGFIMWIPCGTLLALVALALFAVFLGELERQRERARRKALA